MTADLTTTIRREGRNVGVIATYVCGYLERRWQGVWEEQGPALVRAWERLGEPAYGLYNRELFRPIQAELEGEGLVCRPALPGSMASSEERWGPQDFRERRMWTVLRDHEAGAVALGTLVMRFFHDHTQLRLPSPPSMIGLATTDDDAVRALVLDDAGRWPAPPAGS